MLHVDSSVYTAVSSLGEVDGKAPVVMIVAFVVKETLRNVVHPRYEEVRMLVARERNLGLVSGRHQRHLKDSRLEQDEKVSTHRR
jgi:hypothetical protein